MKVIIGGDLVPTNRNLNLFVEAKVEKLIGKELLTILNDSDIRIYNLETPISDVTNPINKYGPNLISPTNTIKGIKALNPTLFTLANNHIMDQGIEGLESTLHILEKYDIEYVGAGANLSEASRPKILRHENKKVGIYACAEHEFTIATDYKPGANPFDPLESLDHIQKLKEKCDFVIVLFHGGKEHFRYPSPYLQKVCRKMVQKGADIVICQHSHCIGCYEIFENSTIIYGQGNFIFNDKDNEFWNTGLLVKIHFEEDFWIEYIPLEKTDCGIRLASGSVKDKILSEFYARSKQIQDENFIHKKYEEFAALNLNKYLRTFAGYGIWLSRIDRKLLNNFLIRKLYKKKTLLAMQNYIECEAHRELLLTGLKGENGLGR